MVYEERQWFSAMKYYGKIKANPGSPPSNV
jgi:hypothetical protein